MKELQKYLKLVLQKFSTLQLPSPDGLGFQVQKLIMTNLKSKKKKIILAWAFFTDFIKGIHNFLNQHLNLEIQDLLCYII